MKLKTIVFAFTAMLAIVIGIEQPLFAAKLKHKKYRQEKVHNPDSAAQKDSFPVKRTLNLIAPDDQLNVSDASVSSCSSIYNNMPPNFQIVDYYSAPDCSGDIVLPFTPNSFPCQPSNTGGYSDAVWNGLWANTLLQLNGPSDCPQLGLAGRLQCGRLGVIYYQNLNGCRPCPDEFPCCYPTLAPTGSTGCGSCEGIQVCSFCPGAKPKSKKGNKTKSKSDCACKKVTDVCPSVPIRILALETYPVSQFVTCSETAAESVYQQQLLSSVSYNLDVQNVAPSLGNRVVSILIQAGYLDSTGTPQVDQIDYSNRQFGPTLDTLYGEKYAANVLLPSDYIQGILAQNPLNTNAAVQIVIYVEEGVEIQVIPLLEDLQPAKNNQTQGNSQINAILQSSGVSGANSQYFSSGGTLELITTPGTYQVTPSSTITLKGGGGGGGGGGDPNFTIVNGGGGGAEGFMITIPVPAGAAFFLLSSVGQGGDGGDRGIDRMPALPGKDGTTTSGYFLDCNLAMIPPVYHAVGGRGGGGARFTTGGAGGNGSAGGGGGGGGFFEAGGPGGEGLNGNDGQPGSVPNGGAGGNNGGKGGLGSFSKAGGGGGAGSPTDINGQVIPGIPGAPGGNGAMNGFSWTNQIQPNLLYGVGGGGGGAGANGGAGAPGYMTISTGM